MHTRNAVIWIPGLPSRPPFFSFYVSFPSLSTAPLACALGSVSTSSFLLGFLAGRLDLLPPPPPLAWYKDTPRIDYVTRRADIQKIAARVNGMVKYGVVGMVNAMANDMVLVAFLTWKTLELL